ncbi:MAG: hypothetical protein GX595_05580, partial [Lentisphaerae bacterium]|nr:hypothetical protein [Lentisphaerota bacterium]
MSLPQPNAFAHASVRCPCREIPPVDLAAVDEIIHEHGTAPQAVVPILQALQKHYNYLPQEAL